MAFHSDRRRPIRASRAIRLRARELRQDHTPAEAALWEALRARQLGGLKFRRQHPVERCIVDFRCAEARLVVEVDGGIHAQQVEQDAERTGYLQERGYTVIRFRNEEVLTDLDMVTAAILLAVGQDGHLVSDGEERSDDDDTRI